MLQLTKNCSKRESYGTKETAYGDGAVSMFNLNPVYTKEYGRFLHKYHENLLYKTFKFNRSKENKILIFVYPVLRNVLRFLNW